MYKALFAIGALGTLASMAAVGYLAWDHSFDPQRHCEFVETRLPFNEQALSEIDIEIEERRGQGQNVTALEGRLEKAENWQRQANHLYGAGNCSGAIGKLEASQKDVYALQLELGLIQPYGDSLSWSVMSIAILFFVVSVVMLIIGIIGLRRNISGIPHINS